MGLAARRRTGRSRKPVPSSPASAAVLTNADADVHMQAGISMLDVEKRLKDRKGKRRADGVFRPSLLWGRDDGNDDNDDSNGASSGGSAGVVLDMSLTGDQTWNPIYTVPVTVGAANQTFAVQVDTGSADFWIASKGCSSQACTSNKPKLYDPDSSSLSTGQTFEIDYLSGQVSGPIVWDTLTLGAYNISNQALAAATTVVNESLSSAYSGLLGLALPLDSVIAQDIQPQESNAPDGATLASNIFGITPTSDAPSQLFFSLLLERPNTNRVPSLLGIGQHPSNDLLSQNGAGSGTVDGPLTIDPSKVAYSDLISEQDGVHFWKVELRALTVYLNGTAHQIDIGHGVSGSLFPEAVVDTGVPYIISTPSIANAVWGALNIQPANDGNYYLPCTTPLNMTVTLDDRTEIPIHPLDLTGVPSGNPGSGTCVGLFQQSPYLATFNNGGVADIILGVPFLRNVYTVLAYEKANSAGTIAGNNNRRSSSIDPQLGLLSITNATTAMNEFNKVRVLRQPLDGNNTSTTTSSDHGLSTGLKVLFGLLGFIVVCAALFGGRWFWARRRSRKGETGSVADSVGPKESKEGIALHAYEGLSPYRPPRPHSQVPSEDTQRTLHDPTMDRFSRLDAKYDSATARTKVGSGSSDDFGFIGAKKLDADSDEFGDGARVPGIGDEGWEPHSSWIDAYSEYQTPLHGEWRPSDGPPTSLSQHGRTYSNSSIHSATSPPSSAAPLLGSNTSVRGQGHSHTLTDSLSAATLVGSPPPPMAMPLERHIDEFGIIDGVGIESIGTATRRGSGSFDPEASRNHRRRTSSLSVGEAPTPVLGSSSPPSSPPVPLLPAPPPALPTTPTHAHARPSSARRPTGPRRSSTMSNVINADDIVL